MEINKKTLYKKDKRGALMVWEIEWNGESYWTTTGQVGGVMSTTAPTFCYPKNVGRANETTQAQQVLLEVDSKVKKQFDNGYTFEKNAEVRFEVSLANKYHERHEKGLAAFPYIPQPKLDGIRCYIRRNADGTIGMFSRKHKQFVSCPHIVNDAGMKRLFEVYPDLVLDGELYNHKLKDDFGKICSIIAKKKLTTEDVVLSEQFIQFNCFDCFFANSAELSYTDRNDKLVEVVKDMEEPTPYLVFVSSNGITDADGYKNIFITCHDEVESRIEKYISQGFEGIMLKKNVPYIMSRSNDLLKYKRFQDAEYEIVDFEEGKGNLAGYATTVVCKDEYGTEFRAGVTGNRDYTQMLFENKIKFVGMKCTVKFQEITPVTENGGGVPRFGKMVAIRNYE